MAPVYHVLAEAEPAPAVTTALGTSNSVRFTVKR
jgi:hypothetical protein